MNQMYPRNELYDTAGITNDTGIVRFRQVEFDHRPWLLDLFQVVQQQPQNIDLPKPLAGK